MIGSELSFVSQIASLLIGLTTLIWLYWYSTRNHDYWKRKCVRYVKPWPLFGNVLENFTQPAHFVERNRYKEYGSIYGFYEGNNPVLSVAKPDLLRNILVKDFFSFPTRRKFPLQGTLLEHNASSLEGEDWKRVRSVISPTFSTGKLKRLLGILKECSSTLTQNIKSSVERGEKIEVKRLFETYIMDAIASSAFSMAIDSRNDPENKFVKSARTCFNFKNWRFMLFLMAPRLTKFLKISIFDKEAERFFRSATYQVIEERKNSGKVRNDYLQLLFEATKDMNEDGKTEEDVRDDIASNYRDENWSDQVFKTVKSKYLTMDEMIGQCGLFFLAGYEGPAATLAYATYHLALNPQIQETLREEVDSALHGNNGELTYEVLQKMKYLDNVISETLRMYPPAVAIERVADTDYKLGDTGITIPKGMLISIPIYAMHMDPKFFKDPENFDPDRFSPEERHKIVPYSYHPFGHGPRYCLGMRLALLEMKVCLAYVIANFILKRGPWTKVPLEFCKGPMLIKAKETIVEFEIRSLLPLNEK